MTNELETTIGLEIHVQLNTKSKMFCSCDNNSEGKEPNTTICPICLGMPGTLPVANLSAIEKTIKIGLALNSTIPAISKFDRKHYFYPDLPKGYQISQYDQPFCVGGWLNLKSQNSNLKVRLNRVHLEEDAGKLIHGTDSKFTIVDLNRAGTPLAEIVTEPDITSAQMAKEFLKELRLILRQIGVSEADMEKGHLRCDANISVRVKESVSQRVGESKSQEVKSEEMSEIVEMKNLNSFKFVEKALLIEEKRLKEKYPDWPKKQTKVTRGFNSKTGNTYTLREKEEAKDYRYFPEPDLPPFDLTAPEFAAKISEYEKEVQALLPSAKRSSLEGLGLSSNEVEYLVKSPKALAAVEKIYSTNPGLAPKIAKLLINEKSAGNLSQEQLFDLARLIEKESLPSNIARDLTNRAITEKKLPSEIHEPSTAADLDPILDEVISQNPDAIQKYKAGKTQVIGFLLGEVMKKTRGVADPNEAKEKLIKKIEV